MTDEPSETHPEPVVVAAYPDRGEAEVTVAHLLANGIEAFIVDQVEGGSIPIDDEIVAVSVRAQDAELAQQVLAPNETD